MNELKSTSSNDDQNMIENMMSYSCKSYFVASLGGYVASIPTISRDNLKHKARQFLLCEKFSLLCNTAFMSHNLEKTSGCIFSLILVKHCDELHHILLYSACSSIQKFDSYCDLIFVFKL